MRKSAVVKSKQCLCSAVSLPALFCSVDLIIYNFSGSDDRAAVSCTCSRASLCPSTRSSSSRSAVPDPHCFIANSEREREMTSPKHKQGLAEIKALENILDGCKLELTAVDEIWPNLYIGNVALAQNKSALKKMGITHILNAAHAKQGSIGDESYYGTEFVYHGIPAEDSGKFDISVHFRSASDFIHKALKKKNGKVLVHCIMGVSRSSTLVLAYLMLRQHLTLHAAIQQVIQRRPIYPNRNFLGLLVELDTQLQRKRMMCPIL